MTTLAVRMKEASAGAGTTAPTSGFVQRLAHNHQGASSSTLVLTLTGTATAGSTVLVAVRTGSGVAVSSVADSRGNTWTVDKTSAASGARAHLVSTPMATTLVTGDTITVTFGAATTNAAAAAYEYAGIAATPVDASASGSSSGVSVTTLNAGTTGTTVQASEVAISVAAIGPAQTSVTPPTGYTERDSGEKNYTTGCVDLAEKILAATGTESPTWTWTVTGSAGAVVVTYKLL